eukprot:9032979-Alexandrium_andersonii.AAC.1
MDPPLLEEDASEGSTGLASADVGAGPSATAAASAQHGDYRGPGGVWASRGAGAWRAGGRPVVSPGAPRG